jgi:hypothetical protein
VKNVKQTAQAFLIAGTVVASIVVLRYLLQTEATKHNISAIITSVIDRPNQAEDGFYQITAERTDNKSEVIIDATGYLNSPLDPKVFGQACVEVPEVKKGDRISFYLPTIRGQIQKYEICHDVKESGYNFHLE